MRELIKKHKIFAAALPLIGLVIFYYAIVVIKAYVETPRIISDILASDKTAMRLEDFSRR